MRIAFLNQAFYPDVASTAQHAADLAVALAARGHQVTVLASRRGYDDPARRYTAFERWQGVEIRRVFATAFGKRARWRRAADFASFLLSCLFRLMLLPRQNAVVAMTTPPLVAALAALFVRLRGGRLVYWVMDLNPDQAIAAGWLRPQSLVTKALRRLLTFSLQTSDCVVALDRFMGERIEAKRVPSTKIHVIAPWAHDRSVRFDPSGRAAFRAVHGLDGCFVVMHSGNHSPCHPLDTLLEAARRLDGEPGFRFCFVGGGSEFARVGRFAARHGLSNVICLPYQPLAGLSASLSAADLHVVLMGDPFVGIVHPCKIYNVLAVGRPVLYIGPRPSHVTDLFDAGAVDGAAVFQARHGEVDRVVALLTEARGRRVPEPAAIAEHSRFSQSVLVPRLVRVVEEGT